MYTQLPQNILMGSAEAFASVASFEFAYFSAPISGQSLFMSLHFCSAGIGSFLTPAFIAIFSNAFNSSGADFDFYVSRQKQKSSVIRFFFFSLSVPEVILPTILRLLLRHGCIACTVHAYSILCLQETRAYSNASTTDRVNGLMLLFFFFVRQ